MVTGLEILQNILERLQRKRQKILDNAWFGWLHHERTACLNETIEEIQGAILEMTTAKVLNEMDKPCVCYCHKVGMKGFVYPPKELTIEPCCKC